MQTTDPELIEPGPWFEWHYDRWHPPAAARSLARTGVAPQAFVAGNSLAVQFHPEVTLTLLRLWLDNGGDADLARAGHRHRRAAGPDRAAGGRRGGAGRPVDGFLDRVATSPAESGGPPLRPGNRKT